MNIKKIAALAAFVAIIGLFFSWNYIKTYFLSNVPSSLNEEFVCFPTGATLEDCKRILKEKGFIKEEDTFAQAAEKMNYKGRSGRFKIKAGWNNKELVQHLRSGEQSPVKVSFNTERTLENIAAKTGRFIEADSAKLFATFTNEAFLQQIGMNKDNLMSIFIPNTYDIFWNTTPEKFVEKMLKERDKFWEKDNRSQKADALALSKEQVYALASIVEKETNDVAEKPTVAGVYLNRLRINMKLQADPTCVFASRDFLTRRVTSYHLSFDSPYNTYLYKGLPPGPISIASASSIDAVLNYDKHNYLYFCAKPDNIGTHSFAETFQQHQVNVDKYIAWLNRRGY
jgi:UPF0755 protein